MDLVDLINEKRFLGQEFLTWVWYQSEINSGLVDLPGFGTVEIWFEDRLMLEAGSGNSRQLVTCQGKDMDLAEARTALKEGKKVSQARLRLRANGLEWSMTIKADGLELSGVRAPKTLEMDEEDPEESLAGRLLDRLAVMQELVKAMDALFARFISLKLSDDWEEQVLPSLRKWLKDA